SAETAGPRPAPGAFPDVPQRAGPHDRRSVRRAGPDRGPAPRPGGWTAPGPNAILAHEEETRDVHGPVRPRRQAVLPLRGGLLRQAAHQGRPGPVRLPGVRGAGPGEAGPGGPAPSRAVRP